MLRQIALALVTLALPLFAAAQKPNLETQLENAAKAGQLTELERLLRAGASLKNSEALGAAVYAGQAEAAKYLVERGADPNGRKHTGWPLYAAALTGNRTLLKYLVERGGDLNAEDPDEKTTLGTPLVNAIYSGKLNAARLLIEFGADVNRVNRHGNTPLHQAIRFVRGEPRDAAEFVSLLLKSGANPDLRDGSGFSARQFAKGSRNPEFSALIEGTRPASAGVPQASQTLLAAVRLVLLYKDFCDLKRPGFKDRSAPAYAQWRKRNAALIAEVEGNPQFMKSIQEERSKLMTDAREQAVRMHPEVMAREIESLCEGELVAQLDATPGGPPSPHYATPEKTWNRYLDALRRADRKAAIACLIGPVRDRYRPLIEQATDEQLRRMAATIKQFRLTGVKFGEFVEALAAREDGRGSLMYFQNVNGEWKINEM